MKWIVQYKNKNDKLDTWHRSGDFSFAYDSKELAESAFIRKYYENLEYRAVPLKNVYTVEVINNLLMWERSDSANGDYGSFEVARSEAAYASKKGGKSLNNYRILCDGEVVQVLEEPAKEVPQQINQLFNQGNAANWNWSGGLQNYGQDTTLKTATGLQQLYQGQQNVPSGWINFPSVVTNVPTYVPEGYELVKKVEPKAPEVPKPLKQAIGRKFR